MSVHHDFGSFTNEQAEDTAMNPFNSSRTYKGTLCQENSRDSNRTAQSDQSLCFSPGKLFKNSIVSLKVKWPAAHALKC